MGDQGIGIDRDAGGGRGNGVRGGMPAALAEMMQPCMSILDRDAVVSFAVIKVRELVPGDEEAAMRTAIGQPVPVFIPFHRLSLHPH